jgi:GH35 family endo-1,4-beta-xylanase
MISIRKSLFATGVALAVQSIVSAQPLPTGERLKDLAGASLIGGRPDSALSAGGPLPVVLEREYNMVQTTWYANFGGLTEGEVFHLNNFNAWVNWAEANNKPVMMHMIAGQNRYWPNFIIRNPSHTPESVEAQLYRIIDRVMTDNDNGRKVDYWNVINEIFLDDGTYRPQSTQLLNMMGFEPDKSGLTGADKVNEQHPVFIRKAFERARRHSPNKLELRDYGIEYVPTAPKTRGAYQLVRHLINSGAPIDAIGFQVHLAPDNNYNQGSWDQYKRNVDKFKSLGVEVYVTEFDLVHADRDHPRRDELYYALVKASREAGVEVFSTWGTGEGYDDGWRNGVVQLLPFNNGTYAPNAAYYAMQRALRDTGDFVVEAKGVVGGEKMTLLLDGNPVRSWHLSRALTGYSYVGFRPGQRVEILVEAGDWTRAARTKLSPGIVIKQIRRGTSIHSIGVDSKPVGLGGKVKVGVLQ